MQTGAYRNFRSENRTVKIERKIWDTHLFLPDFHRVDAEIRGVSRITELPELPEDVQGIVDRLDVGGVPKDKGFLWSGDKEGTRAIATDRGGMTLEGTRGGKVIDNWDYLNEKMPWDQGGEQVWGGASENYTSQLEGNVTALQTPDKAARGGGDIFKTYEWPKVRDGLDSGRITDFNIEIIPEP